MTERPKILLVESDPAVALACAAALRRQGWEPLAASDGTSALSTAVRARPDAIVLNATLPGDSATALLRRLRASVHTAVTPVIVIARDGAERWLAAGAQECVASATDVEGLGAALRRHLAQPRSVAEAPRDVVRDATRMAALKASGLLDSAPEHSFDRVTQLAAKVLGVPVALLSLVDKDRQFFKSQTGLPEPWAARRETPLSHSFCQWVISGRERIAIDDARAHPLLQTNLAIRDLGVVSYAGVPVYGSAGQALGSFCAIDSRPRAWSEADLETLQDLAKMAEACAAQSELARQEPASLGDFDRFVGAAGDAIRGAVGIVRRSSPALSPPDQHVLLEVIEQHGQHLVQLNRLIQVTQALH